MQGLAIAEPCLLIYPLQKTVFRFDPSKYILIPEGDSLYDELYGKSGVMLWDPNEQRIPYEVYQSPNLQGFEHSSFGRNEFFIPRKQLTIAVDGFYHAPRRLNDIFIRFIPIPADAVVEIRINGVLVDNLYYHIPSLLVTTLLGNGYYSDALTFDIEWTGPKGFLVTAFADKNGNRVYDGEPCFSVFMEDPSVPTEATTWGRIKSLYKD